MCKFAEKFSALSVEQLKSKRQQKVTTHKKVLFASYYISAFLGYAAISNWKFVQMNKTRQNTISFDNINSTKTIRFGLENSHFTS